MTPRVGPSPRRGARGRAGWPAADLGAIRRSDELIEMLAGRRVPPRALGDPAVAVLRRLTADIDAPPGHAAWPPGPRHRAGRPRRTWPHAAAAAAVAAAIATLTAVAAAALVIVGMFARLRDTRR